MSAMTPRDGKMTRVTARMDREFVVFLIGMRINRWWRPDQWLPVAMAMPKMMRELEAQPERGLLGWESGGFANPTIMVQYWESLEKLLAYARASDAVHLPAWSRFMKAARTDAVGIWHETYVVTPGRYENVYGNFPEPFGLGKVGELVPASGVYASAARRVEADAA